MRKAWVAATVVVLCFGTSVGLAQVRTDWLLNGPGSITLVSQYGSSTTMGILTRIAINVTSGWNQGFNEGSYGSSSTAVKSTTEWSSFGVGYIGVYNTSLGPSGGQWVGCWSDLYVETLGGSSSGKDFVMFEKFTVDRAVSVVNAIINAQIYGQLFGGNERETLYWAYLETSGNGYLEQYHQFGNYQGWPRAHIEAVGPFEMQAGVDGEHPKFGNGFFFGIAGSGTDSGVIDTRYFENKYNGLATAAGGGYPGFLFSGSGNATASFLAIWDHSLTSLAGLLQTPDILQNFNVAASAPGSFGSQVLTPVPWVTIAGSIAQWMK